MIKRDLYAFVTDAGWQTKLTSVRPHAPLYGDYRLLVFTESELPKLEAEYADADFKYLEPSETIEQMASGTIGPFICNIEQAREVAAYFTPEEITNGVFS